MQLGKDVTVGSFVRPTAAFMSRSSLKSTIGPSPKSSSGAHCAIVLNVVLVWGANKGPKMACSSGSILVMKARGRKF